MKDSTQLSQCPPRIVWDPARQPGAPVPGAAVPRRRLVAWALCANVSGALSQSSDDLSAQEDARSEPMCNRQRRRPRAGIDVRYLEFSRGEVTDESRFERRRKVSTPSSSVALSLMAPAGAKTHCTAVSALRSKHVIGGTRQLSKRGRSHA